MTLPLLSYPPTSQNQRVSSYEVGGDEQPRIYDSERLLSESEKDALIQAAYRQIFHEQHMLQSYRQPFLESQLRANQITTKDFIRGLATSDPFRRLNYESNNNYRFVQLCIQRILGRDVFGTASPLKNREKMAWSTVIATQGANAFIDALLNSEEYEQNFGDSVVPYQRRRMLPHRSRGDLPFMRMARYDRQERPDLVGQPLPNWIDPDQDVGKGLFIAATVLLAIAALILAFGSAASL
jgi:phycobilisome rod-core linker protein